MQLSEKPIFYDLSEIFFNARSRVKIYGVIRVIAEIGLELQRISDGIRFVIFSPGHDCFFEIDPCFAHLHDSDAVDIGLPASATPRLLRSVFHRWASLRYATYVVTSPLVQAHNRRRWKHAGIDLPRANLTDSVLISAARPKYIVEYLRVLRTSGTRLIAMLHDMIPLHDEASRPRHQVFKGDNALIVREAAGIVANSEFTRAEILRFATLGLIPPLRRIHTVRLAHECRDIASSVRVSLPAGPYFLCVGSAVGRKNLQAVFDAMHLIQQTGAVATFSLVVAGHTGRATRDWLARKVYDGIRKRVFLFDSPSHAELLQLYQRATAVIVPTRMEGWGLPAGEALWLGTPVICADIPALRESTGGLGLYFNPDSPKALARVLIRLLSDTSFIDEQRCKIRSARDRLRPWSKVAKELLDEALTYAHALPIARLRA